MPVTLDEALRQLGLTAAGFTEQLHPRDAHGRWLKKGDLVEYKTGHIVQKGHIRHVRRDGSVNIESDQILNVDGSPYVETGVNPSILYPPGALSSGGTGPEPEQSGEFGEGEYELPSSGGHHSASNEERHALRVPPAWTAVTVADDQENAEVLARGRDGKGRVQAIYSAKHSQAAAAAKFERINAFAAKVPRLDVALRNDVAHSDTAAAVLAMRRLGIRVGSTNDTHAKQQAYGTTTLQARHVTVIGDHTSFDFIGKKGVHIQLETDDPEIADALRPRLAGKGPDDPIFNTNEQQTIAYLRSHTGPHFKNHDLRTLLANEIAQREVNRDLSPAKTKAEFTRRRNAVGDAVSAQLANNRSEALKSYVSPAVFRQWDPEGQFNLTAAGVWDEAKHPREPHGEFGRVEGWIDPHDEPSLAGKVTPTGGRYKNELYPAGQPWRPERSPFDRFGNYAADNLDADPAGDRGLPYRCVVGAADPRGGDPMIQAADILLEERYQLMRDFKGTTRYEPSSPPGTVPDDPDPGEDDD